MPGKSQPDGVPLPVRVGGCLARHWRQWQAIGAETWVVTVLRDGYRVPFKDSPPPLSRTPVSFPTYRAGSPRAQALWQEVEAMLAKGALEIARDPGPSFYSRLFLVEEATGGWRPMIDRDDSFRSVLGLIRNFHGMEEPAGVPSARCKTSLASAYGLMSEVSPAFTVPASPLVRSLLDDTNLALSKLLEDQTVHGFLPVPGRRHRRYYRTSSSSFPGPYTVPPGVTSITLEKVSEAKKRSVALSASQVSSMEAMLSGVCEVSSWLDWWLSTCGGFRDHLPVEVRADFERLMISGIPG